MIKRIYIDNFRCLVNFEMELTSLQLVLGGNGSGKSTVLDALLFLQRHVCGNRLSPKMADSLTAWQIQDVQRFALDLEIDEHVFTYELELEHKRATRQVRIVKERVCQAGAVLFSFINGVIQLYRDDLSEGPSFSYDWEVTGLSAVTERGDNQKLSKVKDALIRGILVVRINPWQMAPMTPTQETFLPELDMSNFVGWLYYLSSDHQDRYLEMVTELKVLWPDFQSFKFATVGEHLKQLRLLFGKKKVEYRFADLSDGQRCLIVLMTLLYCLNDVTLVIDEPENSLALPEIQPWLLALRDRCDEGELQAVVISHHPEFINVLAANAGIFFERQANGPTRVRPIREEDTQISELVARGWLS